MTEKVTAKKLNNLRTKRAFDMKQKAFSIIFKWLLLKQIKTTFFGRREFDLSRKTQFRMGKASCKNRSTFTLSVSSNIFSSLYHYWDGFTFVRQWTTRCSVLNICHKLIVNKEKGRIPKCKEQENKACQIFRKANIS